jgi:CO/xanthine dehydrogenase Mo-binding subunit
VVAVDQWTAQQAAKLVKVEYKRLEPVIITLEVEKESSTLFVFQKR